MLNLQPENTFKEKIKAKQKPIGTFCELVSENVVETLGELKEIALNTTVNHIEYWHISAKIRLLSNHI